MSDLVSNQSQSAASLIVTETVANSSSASCSGISSSSNVSNFSVSYKKLSRWNSSVAGEWTVSA